MSGLSEDRLRDVLAGLVIVLLAVPVGGALWLGVAHGESPCILCWAQRTSMVLIALVALFVVRYGARPRYLGMVVLLCAWGAFMALRHSALHLARDVGQGFAGAILGAHTYTWAGIIHWVVLVVVGALLLLLRGSLGSEPGAGAPRAVRPVGRVGSVAMALLVLFAGANAVQAFISTGPPPYIGQGDPIRLSLNPRLWVWSLAELEGRVSWRGAWTIPSPDPAAADPDPANGPLANLPTLPVRWERIGAGLEGELTELAGAPEGGERFIATTSDMAVYLLDATLARVRHRVVLDKGFSIDLSPLAGAALLGDTLAVLSTNKSYVLLRPDPAADADREWRHFLESDGGVAELRRGRFATVRARQQYVLALAYHPGADELLTVSVPSPRQPRLVVSRFARADFLLASEFELQLGAALAWSGADRRLSEYLVTGAVVAGDVLYAISAAYSTLLVIDLDTRSVVAAYALPGLDRPVGLAARGTRLLAAHANGRVAVFERPGSARVGTRSDE